MSNLPSILQAIRDAPAIILYFENQNCQPCQTLRAKVKQLLVNHYPRVQLQTIDATTDPACPAHFQVFSAPTVLVFFDGKECYRNGVFTSIRTLDATISRYYQILLDSPSSPDPSATPST